MNLLAGISLDVIIEPYLSIRWINLCQYVKCYIRALNEDQNRYKKDGDAWH